MDNKIIKDCLTERKNLYCSTAEQFIECSVSLADYYPDIVKIYNCESEVNIYSADVIGDKISIDGNVVTRTVYSGDDGKISVFDNITRFSKNIDFHSDTDKNAVTVNAHCERFICRAISPKKAEIKGYVVLNINVFSVVNKEYISDFNDDYIQQKKCVFGSKKMTADKVEVFNVKECFDVIGNSKCKKIYRVNSYSDISDIKCVSDKAMIKGKCNVNIVYIDENDALTSQLNTLDFSQIADISGIGENDICNAEINVRSCETELCDEAGSPNGRFDISLILECEIKSFTDFEIHGVPDVFSVKDNTETKTDKIKRINDFIKLNEIFSAQFESDFAEECIVSVEDCNVNYISYTKTLNDGKLTVNGNIYVSVSAKNNDNLFVFAQRVFEFDFEKKLSVNYNDCDINICENSFRCVSVKSNKCNFVCDLFISGYIYNTEYIDLVTDLTVTEKTEKIGNSKINIYFANKDEDIWDIAKKYRTSVDEIKTVNSLEKNVLDNDKTLIFSSL